MPGSAGAQLSVAIGDWKMSLRRESLPAFTFGRSEVCGQNPVSIQGSHPVIGPVLDTLHKGSLWVLDPFVSTEMGP